MKKLAIIFLFVNLCGCAISQEILIEDGNGDRGELVVQFSDNISNVRATLDDRLIETRRRLTKELRLQNIKPGEYTLRVSAASWELKDDLDFEREVAIRPGEQSAVIVSVPPKSGGYWAFQAVTFVVTLSLALRYTN
jgi:predicted phage tail protein